MIGKKKAPKKAARPSHKPKAPPKRRPPTDEPLEEPGAPEASEAEELDQAPEPELEPTQRTRLYRGRRV